MAKRVGKMVFKQHIWKSGNQAVKEITGFDTNCEYLRCKCVVVFSSRGIRERHILDDNMMRSNIFVEVATTLWRHIAAPE